MKYSIKDFLDKKIDMKADKKDWPAIAAVLMANGVEFWGCDDIPLPEIDEQNFDESAVKLIFYGDRLWRNYCISVEATVPFSDLLLHTPDDFYAGRIGIRCETREEYDALMREIEAARPDVRWICGNEKPTAWKCVDAYKLGPHRIRGNALFNDHPAGVPSVPFSTLFPSDPWAEFVAGKCYLRVKKEEWAAFAKRCEAAGLERYDRGLFGTEKANRCFSDPVESFVHRKTHYGRNAVMTASPGNPTYDFSTLLPAPAPAPDPQPYDGRGKHKVGDKFELIRDVKRMSDTTWECGETVTLVRDDGSDCPKFRRDRTGRDYYTEWRDLKPYAPLPRIEITTDGRVTTATLYDGGKAVRTGTVEGEHDFEKGARLAFIQLIRPYHFDFVHERVSDLREAIDMLDHEIKAVIGE